MGIYGVIDFDDEEIEAAGHWYGGQGSMLYAITSTGSLRRGTIRPRHGDGTPMTDDEWIADLAERLAGEAEEAARDAKKQAKKAKGAEKKELLADADGLSSIAFKANAFVRDAARASTTSTTASHARRARHHATRKSPAQLQREIDEVLAKPSAALDAAIAKARTKASESNRRQTVWRTENDEFRVRPMGEKVSPLWWFVRHVPSDAELRQK